MKLNSFSLAALVIILLFGGIGFTTAMNWWHTETTKVPATYTEGEAAGQYNPADIRGSYSFGDISSLFDIPLVDLQTAFRIPAGENPAAFQVKSLESAYPDLAVEVGTASVRMFVAFYKGLPFDLTASEETYLFPEAAPILKSQQKLTADQVAYLDTHLVPETLETAAPVEASEPTPAPKEGPADTSAQQEEAPSPTVLPTEHVVPEKTVNGLTTFQDLLNWGVTQDAIEAVLGDKMPEPNVKIKDYMSQKGLKFSDVKDKFQNEVDQHK